LKDELLKKPKAGSLGIELRANSSKSCFSAGERFRSGSTEGRKREEAGTVSLNHPLAANLREAGELCGNFNTYS